MKASRVLMVAAAFCFATASIDAAQGPKAGRGAAGKTQTAPATRAQGPKADRPTPQTERAQGPKERARRPAGQEGRTIAGNIARNPQQEARLKAMLPAGMTLEQAADGFRNQGQFIAALEASKNRSIPFADLKAEMTGENALSLGQAMQKLRPEETTAAQ
jgi:hypothetical protein